MASLNNYCLFVEIFDEKSGPAKGGFFSGKILIDIKFLKPLI